MYTDANEVVLQATAHVFRRPVLPSFFDEIRQKLEVVQRRNHAALAVPVFFLRRDKTNTQEARNKGRQAGQQKGG